LINIKILTPVRSSVTVARPLQYTSGNLKKRDMIVHAPSVTVARKGVTAFRVLWRNVWICVLLELGYAKNPS